jgi:energy-coupling factor transporter ATP-binding protein EcfA2
MQSLYLENFKAFREEFNNLPEKKLEIDGKNFLLYGENGSGKSSIYEAIKIIFFRERLENSIPSASTPEEKEQNRDDFWSKYNNKKQGSDFKIKINDTDCINFSVEEYQPFMISIDKFCIEERIELSKLLENFDLSISDIEDFCSTKYKEIENNINTKLEEFREKNIKITIDNEDDFSIKIEDTSRDLKSKDEVRKYFNEAKLNLIILLLLFESIKLAQNSTKKKILVLDDFITSLDISNRTFLMKYIFYTFSEFQLFIFTHNVYFYNLIMYMVNDIEKNSNRWKYVNLYEINGEHRIYIKDGIERVADIKNYFNQSGSDISIVGNKIRQKFEILLYEFSKLLMVGAVEDSKKILERIENGKNIYFKNKLIKKDKNKTASHLIDEILEMDSLEDNIKDKILEYKKDGFKDIQKVVRELKLYQKVTLHPMSHGTIGESSFTINEIGQSLDLLEKFEGYLKGLSDSDVDGA